ncbi:MFS transporter [Alicyclobacillus fastidiosus]|uniref:MFS transporter n=1 Tax=Alicyclobacillus fastidiosus TaxID=392011 RepID=A0ABV5ADE6_9BACL|nr:MFS transporter [Alicyclobacillus fastidiosus]WEH08743.1 MFS transporter [Alicyclobacillus fastidiosus]
MNYIEQGTKEYRRVNLALFLGAFVTFANLYAVQPLLPRFTETFHIQPATASLSLSLATVTMAIGQLLAGSLSEAWGRRPIMLASLICVSAASLASACTTNFVWFLLLRTVQGFVLAGMPAAAMAYLGEEIHPNHLGRAMGLYISGNSIGGMVGRIIAGLMAGLSWRYSILTVGLIGVLITFWSWRNIPESRHFSPQPLRVRSLTRTLLSHFRDPGLLVLFAMGFVLMGGFVTFYNYMPFRLERAPYHLPQSVIAWLFLLYIVGTWSSTWMGQLADKYGRRRMLWVAVGIYALGDLATAWTPLALQVLGIGLLTFGFFGGHALASSWVGRRARRDRAQASSLYLFFYYMGSSVGGSLGGIFYSSCGWQGVAWFVGVFTILGFVGTWLLARMQNVQMDSKGGVSK